MRVADWQVDLLVFDERVADVLVTDVRVADLLVTVLSKYSFCFQCCGSRSGIRYPVPF